MGWVQNRFEENFVVTSVDWALNWARANSLWPMTFGLACCAIEMMAAGAARFDLDRYGRIYMPNAITNSVRIVDNAGNEIIEFGKYGNFDSLYMNPNAGGGKKGEPTVAVPDIPLGWPTAVGVTRDAIYVCDTYNRRAVRVVPVHAAEETCPVK